MGKLTCCLLISLIITSTSSCSRFQEPPATTEERISQAVAKGDTSKAIKLLDGLIHADDTDPEYYARLGALYRSQHTIVDRLRSQKVLEEGLRKHEDDPNILLELGKTNYEQRFYPDASRRFKKALSSDSTLCDASHYLGMISYWKWKHVQIHTDDLLRAHGYFRQHIECSPENEAVFAKLAFTTYALGREKEAMDVCRSLLLQHPKNSDAHFLMGVIHYENKRYELCAASFDLAMAALSSEERADYLSITILFGGQDDPGYDDASMEMKRDILRNYWLDRDRDPTTEVNELYLEHLYRVVIADYYYSLERLGMRGWDTERGRIFIKFGHPWKIHTALGGGQDGYFENWMYRNGPYFFQVSFLDQFLNGNYIIPININSDARILYDSPPISTFRTEIFPIPGVLDVVTFREDETLSAVYLAVSVALDTMKQYVNLSKVKQFNTRTVFFDEMGRRALEYADTLSSNMIQDAGRKPNRDLPLLEKHTMPFDRHRVAFSFGDGEEKIRSILKSEANTLRYVKRSLAMSDVLLCRSTAAAPDRPTIERGKYSLTPNVVGFYDQDEKLEIYFEIYNLNVRQRRSEYDITYSIFEAPGTPVGKWTRFNRGLKRMIGLRKEQEPMVSQTLMRSSPGFESREALSIDIDHLEPGRYELRIEVVDRRSGEKSEGVKRFAKRGPQS